MLIWNKASEGIIKPSYYFQNWPAENPTKRKSFLGRLLSYAIRQPTPEPLKLHASLLDVSYWHKTDIDADVEHVRFWKASGHALTKAFLCRGGPYDLTSVKALKLSRPHLSLPTFP
jgi:hypothetical protein